jgi:hypothetical protein
MAFLKKQNHRDLRACSISGKILGVHEAGGKIAKRFCAAAVRAQGIAAESPQDLH